MELLADPDVKVRTLRCTGGPSERPYAVVGDDVYELCLVRDGCFHARGPDHVDVLADPSTCLLGGPGHVVEVTHPCSGGDVDTLVQVSRPVLASIAGDSLDLPATAQTSGELAQLHMRLLASARRSLEPAALEECAIHLFATAIEQSEPARVAAGEPAKRRQQQIVDDARSALMTNLDLSVVQLARIVGCSPHHLSRLFVRQTGAGVARYRLMVRVQRALDAMVGGETDLSAIAADCGFADQAHLTRAVKAFTGASPSGLRAAVL
jgi:AraC-like DNA-binding protein